MLAFSSSASSFSRRSIALPRVSSSVAAVAAFQKNLINFSIPKTTTTKVFAAVAARKTQNRFYSQKGVLSTNPNSLQPRTFQPGFSDTTFGKTPAQVDLLAIIPPVTIPSSPSHDAVLGSYDPITYKTTILSQTPINPIFNYEDIQPSENKHHSARNSVLLKKIFRASKQNDVVSALDAYQFLTIRPDVRVYTALFKTLIEGAYITEAVQIYHDMKKQGVTPNLVTFTNLVKICQKANHLGRAFWFLKELLAHKTKIHPKRSNNRHLIEFYETIMRICINNHNFSRATALWVTMRRKSVPIAHSANGPAPKAGMADMITDLKLYMFLKKLIPTSTPMGLSAQAFQLEMARALHPHTKRLEDTPLGTGEMETAYNGWMNALSQVLKKKREERLAKKLGTTANNNNEQQQQQSSTTQSNKK